MSAKDQLVQHLKNLTNIIENGGLLSRTEIHTIDRLNHQIDFENVMASIQLAKKSRK